MEMENSKVLIQFLLIFRQSGDVLFFLYARRLRGYTATGTQSGFIISSKILEELPVYFQYWSYFQKRNLLKPIKEHIFK